VPGVFLRPRRRGPATDLFGALTRLERLVLAAKLRQGKITARQSALQ
jgi:hypothetical protein